MTALDPGVAARIARWRPSSVSREAACFARAAVTRAAPHGRERAKNLLWAAAKLADFAIPLGLEPVPEVLLHPSVTGRFAAGAPGLSGAARRTLRTNLRFLARRVVPELGPAPAPLPRELSKAPYGDAEIAAYLALAGAQPARARRMRAAGLICLGAGAGLTGTDLRHAAGLRSVRRGWPGHRRARPGPPQRDHAADNGAVRRDRPAPPRYRAAAGHLAAGLRRAARPATAFLHAAGITCSQRLGDIAATLDPADETGAVALLGGTR